MSEGRGHIYLVMMIIRACGWVNGMFVDDVSTKSVCGDEQLFANLFARLRGS